MGRRRGGRNLTRETPAPLWLPPKMAEQLVSWIEAKADQALQRSMETLAGSMVGPMIEAEISAQLIGALDSIDAEIEERAAAND